MPLLRLFLDISLLRKGPQDVPAAGLLLALTMLADFVLNAILLILESPWETTLLQAVAEILVLTGFVWGMLSIGRKLPRFRQTATATFGCDCIISAVAIPVLAFAAFVPEARDIVGILLLGVTVWQLMAIGHVWRHALGVSLGGGFGLALLYMALTYEIMMRLLQSLE